MASSVATAAPTNETSRVFDGGGAHASNSRYQAVSAIAQGRAPKFTFNGSRLNKTGFLHTFLDGPAIDADADGDGFGDWTGLSGLNAQVNWIAVDP
jgi:hypothetical protein